MTDLFDFYPYAERYGVNREIPASGRSREEILGELREMATEEDAAWEDGKCSGTMYCGDRDHYGFLKEAFGLFAHQNALQRDMCPSATRFEGEIIAMALDLMHAGDLNGEQPAGMVTSGGSASIAQAVLAYREQGREARGIDAAEPGEAGDRASRLRQGVSPLRRRDAPGRDRSRDHAGSAGDRGGADRREHGGDRRLGRELRLRDDRPDRRAWDSWRWSGASVCTSTAASAATSCRSGSSSACRSRRSTSGFRASAASPRTPTSTAMA